MNITLPKTIREWVDEQVAAGEYGDPSAYLQELIRRDRKQKIRRRIEQALLEGLNSGPATPMTPKDWDNIRKEARRRVAARKRKK